MMNDILTEELIADKKEDGKFSDKYDIDFSYFFGDLSPKDLYASTQNYHLLNPSYMDNLSLKLLKSFEKETSFAFELPKDMESEISFSTQLNAFISTFMYVYCGRANETDYSLANQKKANDLLTAKEALTFSLYKELKDCDSLEAFLQSSSNVVKSLNSGYLPQVLKDCVDKNLFINLTLRTALDDPISNSLKLASTGNTNYIKHLSIFFEETMKADYLNEYGKSAQRMILENIHRFIPSEKLLNSAGDVDNNIISPNFTPAIRHNSNISFSFTDKYLFTHLPEIISSIYDSETNVLLKNASNIESNGLSTIKNRMAPTYFHPDDINPSTHSRYDLLDSVYQKHIFPTNNTLWIHALYNNDFIPFILSNDSVLFLTVNLPRYVKSVAYMASIDNDFFASITNSQIDANFDIQNSIISTDESYNVFEGYVLGSVMGNLMKLGVPRREASKFIKTIVDYKVDNYRQEIFNKKLDCNFL